MASDVRRVPAASVTPSQNRWRSSALPDADSFTMRTIVRLTSPDVTLRASVRSTLSKLKTVAVEPGGAGNMRPCAVTLAPCRGTAASDAALELTVLHEGSGRRVCRRVEPALAEENVLAELEAHAESWGAPGTITSDHGEMFSLLALLDWTTSRGYTGLHVRPGSNGTPSDATLSGQPAMPSRTLGGPARPAGGDPVHGPMSGIG